MKGENAIGNELARVKRLLAKAEGHDRNLMYGAQQALEWVLHPLDAAAPSKLLAPPDKEKP
jgi:hypothetical protein